MIARQSNRIAVTAIPALCLTACLVTGIGVASPAAAQDQVDLGWQR